MVQILNILIVLVVLLAYRLIISKQFAFQIAILTDSTPILIYKTVIIFDCFYWYLYRSLQTFYRFPLVLLIDFLLCFQDDG